MGQRSHPSNRKQGHLCGTPEQQTFSCVTGCRAGKRCVAALGHCFLRMTPECNRRAEPATIQSVPVFIEVAAWQGAGLGEPRWVPGKLGKSRTRSSPILRPRGNSNQPQAVTRAIMVLMTTVKVVVTVIFPLSPQIPNKSDSTGLRITKDAALWVRL